MVDQYTHRSDMVKAVYDTDNDGKIDAIKSTSKLELYELGGAAESASGELMGVGTSVAPATSSTANGKLIEIRGKTTATSGDNRLYYGRYEIGGAGAGGESFRSFTDLTVAASTAHGGHVSLQADDTGYVSGLGAGFRQQLYLGDAALPAGGTYYGGLTEIYSEGSSSDISATTKHAIHSFQASGDATGGATVLNVLDVVATSAADATKAVSSVSLSELPAGTVGIACTINGTRYYIPAVVDTEWN